MALSGTCVYFHALFDTFVTLLSWIAKTIEDGAHLASGEKLAVGVIASSFQLLTERLVAVDPAHQVAGGGAGVAVGEVEHGKLLFAVTTDLHNDLR